MDPLSIALFIVLFLLSAFFSGSEIAFMSIPSYTVDALIKKRKFGAKMLKYLKSNVERLLITILIGNNLVNVSTSALATKISIDIAENAGWPESATIGIATGIITMLLLLFGEILPKTIATRYAVSIALGVSTVYYWLQIILKPVIIIIEFIIRLFKRNQTEHLNIVTAEEIGALLELGKKQGSFDEFNHKLIKNMLKFEEITVEEVMTPRVKIEALNSNITVNEAIKKAMSFSHSRIPVYSDKIDNIERIITIKELFSEYRAGKGDNQLHQIKLKEAYKVPMAQPIDTLIKKFKHSRSHIAIVMDPYGGVEGLVTLEDIIEAIFGDFQDETDKEIVSIQKHGNDLLVQADSTIDELLESLKLDYNDLGIDPKQFGGETISYYLTSYLERFPKQGEEIIFEIHNHEKDKRSLNVDEENSEHHIPHKVTLVVHKANDEKVESIIVKTE